MPIERAASPISCSEASSVSRPRRRLVGESQRDLREAGCWSGRRILSDHAARAGHLDREVELACDGRAPCRRPCPAKSGTCTVGGRVVGAVGAVAELGAIGDPARMRPTGVGFDDLAGRGAWPGASAAGGGRRRPARRGSAAPRWRPSRTPARRPRRRSSRRRSARRSSRRSRGAGDRPARVRRTRQVAILRVARGSSGRTCARCRSCPRT